MQKKIPMRQCLGCREMKPKRELIRAVKSPDGEVSLDFKGKMPGRGAYLCPNGECLKKAMKSKALERAFSTQIPAEINERESLESAWPYAQGKRSAHRRRGNGRRCQRARGKARFACVRRIAQCAKACIGIYVRQQSAVDNGSVYKGRDIRACRQAGLLNGCCVRYRLCRRTYAETVRYISPGIR